MPRRPSFCSGSRGRRGTGPDKARIALREAELIADAVGRRRGRDRSLRADLHGARSDLPPRAAGRSRTCRRRATTSAAAANALERELKIVTDPTRARADRHAPREPLRADRRHRADHPRSRRRSKRGPGRLRRARAASASSARRPRSGTGSRSFSPSASRSRATRPRPRILTRKLSGVLADKLNRGDEALAALAEMADQGDEGVRAAYIELGDRLGWRGIVATKVVEWWLEAKPEPGADRAPARRVRALRRGRPRPGCRARRHRSSRGARAPTGRSRSTSRSWRSRRRTSTRCRPPTT